MKKIIEVNHTKINVPLDFIISIGCRSTRTLRHTWQFPCLFDASTSSNCAYLVWTTNYVPPSNVSFRATNDDARRMDKQQSCQRTRRIRLTYYSLTSLRNVNSSNESIKPIHDFSKSKFIGTKFPHSQILFELSQHLSFEYSVTVRDVSLYPAKNHLEIFQFLRSDPVLWKFPRFSWLHAHSEYAFSETEDRQQAAFWTA